ncbi:MAG: glutathione S-transferase family protein [Haloarculaceae archaeon]
MVNMFVDGEWRTDAYESTDDEGEFQRDETAFRDRIRDDPDATYPAEPGRYHLYVSRACPWAHGAVLVRRLAGLTDVVSMDVLDPYRDEDGWQFTPEKPGCDPDTVNGFDYLREAYVASDPDYTGRVSVPVLWDTEREEIVNNESIEVMRMLATAFDAHGNGVDLYPEGHRDAVDRVVSELYDAVNNGVYRAGFADSQPAYEEAVADLFDALDRWDDVLADRRYLVGEQMTLADLRLFPTLVRFDEVYHTHFKCNVREIRDYEHLWPYLRDLYQTPGVAATVDMGHIKEHYYTTHADLNPKGIVPVGPDPDFAAPHDRDALPGDRPAALDAAR